MFRRSHRLHAQSIPRVEAVSEVVPVPGPLATYMETREPRLSDFTLNIIGDVWVEGDFWAEPGPTAACEFTLDDIRTVMDMRFSAYVELMRQMEGTDQARATRLLRYVSETDFTTQHAKTVDEVMYPNYLVHNSANADFTPYTLSQEPAVRGGFQVFDLAQPGGEDYMDQLRLRGFVYVDF